MAMKIAIPHWQGRVSPVFDASDAIVVIDIERGRERRRDNFRLASLDPVRRAQEVARLGAEVVLCGAVSRTLENALIGAGVRVKGFVCGDLEALVEAFLAGTLSDACFQMPGAQRAQPPAAPGPEIRKKEPARSRSQSKRKQHTTKENENESGHQR
ncbi:MAG: NifB/NifX family molybdenum-iron cluster-binding protein [Desulfobacterales bacterium]